METKNIKIDVPEGWEIDKENSTFENIVFKKKEEQLPTKWKDFGFIRGWYINSIGEVASFLGAPRGHNINTWPTKELAEASLALCQLVRYRDAWNKGWKPDWTNKNEMKYGLFMLDNKLVSRVTVIHQFVLSFKTPELRDKFLVQFKDLLEIAKPLL